MKKRMLFKRVLCSVVAVLLTVTVGGSVIFAAEDTSASEYRNYIAEYKDKSLASNEIVLNYETLKAGEIFEQDGKKCIKINSENNFAEFYFKVENDGLYNINVTYFDLLGDSLSLKLGFAFDGITPYFELKSVSFSKVYVPESSEIEKDEFGNDVRPTLVGKQCFRSELVESEAGMQSEPYAVYLTAGEHILRVNSVLGDMLISEIKLSSYKKAVAYEDYIQNYGSQNSQGNQSYKIEAENVFEVSSSTLAPTIESTDAGMSPVSATKKLVNSFGQTYWKSNGQWGSWIVPDEVDEGLYEISFRAKQNGSVGISSYRKLYINGEVPFSQAENISFEYNSKWQIKTLGDDNPYCVYLKPGDVLTLKATTGEMADVINDIYATLDKLNEIYQSIIIVTGTSPDSERDYNIQREIPTLLDSLSDVRNDVKKITDSIAEIMGDTNSKVYFLKRFVTLIDSFLNNYRNIVPEISTFKEYIDSLASQTYDFNSSPLELDWIMLSKAQAKKPNANASFWKSAVFEIKRFLFTFSSNYSVANSTEGNGERSVVVWCGLGRDQAQAVKSIIENKFVPQSGINIDFKMTATSLSEAILAGREPDVSLSVAQEVPVDLALRGQALDISPYLDKMSDEYMSQFNSSAFIPFEYKNGVYAMPISQDYYMMFYREDILNRLGIEVPQTWDDLYYVMRKLQKSNFKVGIKESDSAAAGVSNAISIFDMFLYQNGGKYFNDDLSMTNFESKEGKSAFKSVVSLYRDYGLDTDFNLLTRFRSGEMPIIITSSSFYQTVAATAQEIAGRWKMTVIPGTLKSDGSIDRTESSVVTGTVILKGAKRRNVADEAFKFVSWWAGSEAQFEYITAMEAIQGVAGRVATANKVTFERLSWTAEEAEVLKAQRNWVTAINQIPGTYIINRSLSNAIRTSYASTSIDPLRQLNIQNRIINDEINRKRAEFEEKNRKGGELK